MKITFLGTAAIGFPLSFCNCENCQKAKKYKGKSLRKRASLLINDEMIILSYKEITDHSTGESWITEFSGGVKSNVIRANILKYDDV